MVLPVHLPANQLLLLVLQFGTSLFRFALRRIGALLEFVLRVGMVCGTQQLATLS